MIDSIGSGASNSTTSNNANNEVILAAFEAKRRAETCPACDPELSTLEIEAAAAVREVSFAVQNISVSEILPRTTELMFLNLTTKEGSSYCIELTIKGWRIASNRNDCMNGGFAAMSIDFGSKFLKIGLVKPGVSMEIVLNKESRRKTPALIHIKDGERVFGDPAMQITSRHPTSQYLENYPHLSLIPTNRSTVALPFGEEAYAIETVLAMILSNAREAAEAFAEQTIKDVVISVPAFFNQAERLAILNAAKLQN
ncbi:unnamed protein product, partial [Mesorhabditis belari]|uniref:Hypoxia up-regulated protein 1 n=1 Tax=Mesorhabditis belari TaxID=2138241 RepID=A0AAF3F8Z4_9BILA